jgi:hypothetical protein
MVEVLLLGNDDDEVLLGYLHKQIMMQVILQIHIQDEIGYYEVNTI